MAIQCSTLMMARHQGSEGCCLEQTCTRAPKELPKQPFLNERSFVAFFVSTEFCTPTSKPLCHSSARASREAAGSVAVRAAAVRWMKNSPLLSNSCPYIILLGIERQFLFDDICQIKQRARAPMLYVKGLTSSRSRVIRLAS